MKFKLWFNQSWCSAGQVWQNRIFSPKFQIKLRAFCRKRAIFWNYAKLKWGHFSVPFCVEEMHLLCWTISYQKKSQKINETKFILWIIDWWRKWTFKRFKWKFGLVLYKFLTSVFFWAINHCVHWAQCHPPPQAKGRLLKIGNLRPNGNFDAKSVA